MIRITASQLDTLVVMKEHGCVLEGPAVSAARIARWRWPEPHRHHQLGDAARKRSMGTILSRMERLGLVICYPGDYNSTWTVSQAGLDAIKPYA